MKRGLITIIFYFALLAFPQPAIHSAELGASTERAQQASVHFNGDQYFNPGDPQFTNPIPGQEARRGGSRWFWRWVFGNDWPEWPVVKNFAPGPPPEKRVQKGVLRVTPIGHATFLIQIDGVNILTDPIWSDRCGPVSWAGPKRHRAPGIRLEDMPAIDAILVSHNHYDHLDLPTLKRFAERGHSRSIVPIGNLELIRGAGIPVVDELDWWQSVRLSPDVTVTLVPAQHFSSRTLWDRNKTLWGGFVVSGPSGNIYYSGDTGYGPHFREIARRFTPIRMAILPISPFRPQQSQEPPQGYHSSVHMGPAGAVKAHMDLDVHLSIAAHFQVFQLGPDGFEDAVNELNSTSKENNLKTGTFIAPVPGQFIEDSGFQEHQHCCR
jgi:L-ascorbate metabolism protein UlaG (beta-lactamase superfamily)